MAWFNLLTYEGKFKGVVTMTQIAGRMLQDVIIADPVSGNPLNATEYKTVAASQTAQILGVAGAIGDYIDSILIIPATTSPGLVTLLDGAISIPIFVGGATSVADLKPFTVRIKAKSVTGAFKLTTGANVSALVMGDFT